jgi:GNAT superfamily N-acetyltransferase
VELADIGRDFRDAFVSNVHVRRAEPGDGATILMIVADLARSHDALHDLHATPEDFEIALFRPDPVAGAFIAFVDGEAAGAVVWHRSFSTFRGKDVMYLEDVVVLARHQRMGVAMELVKAAAREAVRRGYPGMYWVMAGWNAGAKAFYEKIGAKLETDTVTCRLFDDALHALAR